MSDRDLLEAAARAAVADTATPTGGEAPLTLSVGMLMEAGLMVGSTPDSVGTSNWAVRMLGALRALAVDQPAAPPVPARQEPPADWSVFNTGAEVAGGLTYAEALEYLTPPRLERGWSAVCVVNKDNITAAPAEGGA